MLTCPAVAADTYHLAKDARITGQTSMETMSRPHNVETPTIISDRKAVERQVRPIREDANPGKSYHIITAAAPLP